MDDNHAFARELNIKRMDDTEAEYIVMAARKSHSIRITFVLFPTLIIEIKIELAKIIRRRISRAKRRLEVKINLTVRMCIVASKFAQEWILIKEIRGTLERDRSDWRRDECWKGCKRAGIRQYLLPVWKWHKSEPIIVEGARNESCESKGTSSNRTGVSKFSRSVIYIPRRIGSKNHPRKVGAFSRDIHNRSGRDDRGGEGHARLSQGIENERHSREIHILPYPKRSRNSGSEIPTGELVRELDQGRITRQGTREERFGGAVRDIIHRERQSRSDECPIVDIINTTLCYGRYIRENLAGHCPKCGTESGFGEKYLTGTPENLRLGTESEGRVAFYPGSRTNLDRIAISEERWVSDTENDIVQDQ